MLNLRVLTYSDAAMILCHANMSFVFNTQAYLFSLLMSLCIPCYMRVLDMCARVCAYALLGSSLLYRAGLNAFMHLTLSVQQQRKRR